MRKHKSKIIAAVIIIAVLAGAWIYGGNFPDNAGTVAHSGEEGGLVLVGEHDFPIPDYRQSGAEESEPTSEQSYHPHDDYEQQRVDEPGPMVVEQSYPAHEDYQPEADESEPEPMGEQSSSSHDYEQLGVGEYESMGEQRLSSHDDYGQPGPEEPEPEDERSPPQHDYVQPGADESEGSDEVEQTASAVVNNPAPVEPENMVIGDDSFTVYLTVRVDNILNNMDMLCREKHELIPADGVIFPLTAVRAYEGESVFNVLQREMRRARIHMVARFTPIFNSAYIEAINNIYEFDVGELSGWMYSVNNWFPNYGASRYLLKPGDVIEWHFTVDLGRDLGEFWLGGAQRE